MSMVPFNNSSTSTSTSNDNMMNGSIATKPSCASKKRRVLGDITNFSKTRLLSDSNHSSMTASKGNVPTSNKFLLPRKANGEIFKAVKAFEMKTSPTRPAPSMTSDGVRPNDPSFKMADDIEKRDSHDPLCVSDYVADMYVHFRKQEKDIKLSVMDNQPYLDASKRSILVDWLIAVHENLRLSPETLYLTVQLIDRFLQDNVVDVKSFQLVGVTALLISSKYEDIYPPLVDKLIYLCDDCFSSQDIFDMEVSMLQALNYEISKPTPHTFAMRFMRAAHADKEMTHTSCYILESTLLDAKLVSKYLPSKLAAASVFIARRSSPNKRASWNATMEKYTGYTETEVSSAARDILEAMSSATSKKYQLNAVDRKYRAEKLSGVSMKKFPCDF